MDPIERTAADLSTGELYDLLQLRTAVFVVEQNCPYQELDGRDLDPGTTHLWLVDEVGITATIRVLTEPDGNRRIGRVVTRADQRGRGLSAFLLDAALARIGGITTVLDAQSHLRTFYERFGYVVAGPEFIEDGIPHVPMERLGVAEGPGR